MPLNNDTVSSNSLLLKELSRYKEGEHKKGATFEKLEIKSKKHTIQQKAMQIKLIF